MNVPELFERSPANPILQAGNMPFPCKAVCNPAACLVGGETVLLLRVVDNEDCSHLLVARSKDGVSKWRIEDTPLLSPRQGAGWYEALGCEDPRITYLADEDLYVIAYIGVSSQGAGVCLATTKDFGSVSRMGLVIHPYNKDAALFPRKIGGQYLLLHRPTAGPLENIWMSEGEDLKHWGGPVCILEEDQQPGWDSGKVGTGPTPIETPDGWLLIFHGVQLEAMGWLYRVGMALLDLDDPSKIIAKAHNWVFGPTEPYELRGEKPGIIFPTGAVVQDGTLRLYYGAADTTVAVASARMDDLLQVLRGNRM